jgi:hypothetical protein
MTTELYHGFWGFVSINRLGTSGANSLTWLSRQCKFVVLMDRLGSFISSGMSTA